MVAHEAAADRHHPRAALASTEVKPDWGSFAVALHTAPDQAIKAAGVLAESTVDLAGAIGRQVLVSSGDQETAADLLYG